MRDAQNPGGTTTPGGAPPPGVCGPDISVQLTAVWTKIQSDFRSWTPEQRDAACTRILIPLQKPVWTPDTNIKSYVKSMADINGWDVLPLYQGDSEWLRSYPIYDADSGGPCATPSSSKPLADVFDDAHEDPRTCSDTVQVGGQCWLNGTVNYGTYGIMVRLCADAFPFKFALALTMAETLIKTYKSVGPHPEDATLPLAWLRATYTGGPGAKPAVTGNRPQCKCTCPCDGSVTNWDYVWEPVKTRATANDPVIPPKPPKPVAPPPLPVIPVAASKTYVVLPGDSLSRIAHKVYGNASQWPKIYQANKASIGPDPNKLNVGTSLTIP
jgi:hypothetical protein